MLLMPCCPSDRRGLPGALIPVSSHAPRRRGRGRRLAGTLLCSRSGLWMPASGPEAIRRPRAIRGLVAIGTVSLAWPANAAWACTGAGRPARTGVNPSQARAPCRPSPCRCGSARSFAVPAMAFPSLSRKSCPVRIVSVHLLDAAGELLRVLFLDREGHISVQAHFVPRAEALILASISRSCSGPRPRCGCFEKQPPAGSPHRGN